ncbi:MAG: transposase-like protein [Alcanivorax sp.]|jgi:transposase-like protein
MPVKYAGYNRSASRTFKKERRGYDDTFLVDEVFAKINGKQYYRWRPVDQECEVWDVYPQEKRGFAAGKHSFFRPYKTTG